MSEQSENATPQQWLEYKTASCLCILCKLARFIFTAELAFGLLRDFTWDAGWLPANKKLIPAAFSIYEFARSISVNLFNWECYWIFGLNIPPCSAAVLIKHIGVKLHYPGSGWQWIWLVESILLSWLFNIMYSMIKSRSLLMNKILSLFLTIITLFW